MKRTISIILVLFSVMIVFSACSGKVSNYTIDEHIFRITKRIKLSDSKWRFPDGETYESFEVYPIYNQNEELKFFMVEFEPYSFRFIHVRNEPPFLISFIYPNKSMYVVSQDIYNRDDPWVRYIANENGSDLSQIVPFLPSGKRGELILDKNGEIVTYDNSPFYVSKNMEEKKYLLKTDCSYEYICAIKKDGKFLNLISGETIDYAETYNSKQNATLLVRFIADRRSDL